VVTDRRSVRDAFGGIDTPAALGGMFAAIGVLGTAAALLALTAIPFQLNAFDIEGNLTELEMAGVAVATLTVLLSFFVGGWVAARVARFDGVMNAIGVALWMLLLVAVSAVAGLYLDERYNLLQRTGLPDWFSQLRGDEMTALGVTAAILGVLAIIAGCLLGGAAGESYNQRVNRALVGDQVEPVDVGVV
jgi:hypothetical protein